MKRSWKRVITAVLLWCAVSAVPALGAGTGAGTEITNKAIVTYDVGETQGLKAESETNRITVAELLEMALVWQQDAPITVAPGDTDQVLIFKLVNAGNGQDAYTLESVNNMGAGNDFDPVLQAIYLDTNGNGLYDEHDTRYVSGDAITLDPFGVGEIHVFVINSIPNDPAPGDGDEGSINLIARSVTAAGAASSAPGTVIAGGGDRGTDAVIGTSGGKAEKSGTYVVSNVELRVLKSSQVTDPFGGSQPVPGATIAYTIKVVVDAGTAENVRITDSIPQNTTYAANSLELEGSRLTDAVGDDAGSVSGDPKSVIVNIGNLEGPIEKTVTFNVTIN